MHVRFMQKVDYYLGIPLCFVFSVLEKIKKIFSNSSFPSELKSLLYIELSEMGSAILAYPAIKKSVEKLGKENVYFLIFEANKESVEVLDIIPQENIITINSKSFFCFAPNLITAIFKIRALKLSAVLDFELFSRCTNLISYLSGAKIRAGFHNYTEEGLYRGELLTHKLYYNSTLHMSQSFMALTDSVLENATDTPLLKKKIPGNLELPRYSPEENTVKKFKDILVSLGCKDNAAKLFILNPDPGLLDLRGWPKENYAKLAKLLLEKSGGNYVAIVGLPHSRKYFEFIKEECSSERVLDLTGKTKDLKELLSLLTLSDCLITNDSGPAHMAALTETKSVVLFGPETPLRYKPLGSNTTALFAGLACSPCFSAANHRHSSCTNNVCMREIKVEEVYEAVLQ